MRCSFMTLAWQSSRTHLLRWIVKSQIKREGLNELSNPVSLPPHPAPIWIWGIACDLEFALLGLSEEAFNPWSKTEMNWYCQFSYTTRLKNTEKVDLPFLGIYDDDEILDQNKAMLFFLLSPFYLLQLWSLSKLQ
jgi:hypothetical protein